MIGSAQIYASTAKAISIYGDDASDGALYDADAENDLSRFASILSKKYTTVVMGHTHVPVNKVDTNSDLLEYIYVNSGFDCPAKPDMEKQNASGRVTFVELEIDSARGHIDSMVRYVVHEGGVAKVASESLSSVRTKLRAT